MEITWARRSVAFLLVWTTFLGSLLIATPAPAQFAKMKEKATALILCGGGAYGGLKLGEKLATIQAQTLHLPPAVAEANKRKFELGLAMSFCNGGKLLANSVFAKMSENDRKARQSDLDAAVANEQPVTKNVALPDHPGITETLTTEAAVTKGSNECKVVKDHVSDGAAGDDALVEYCRKPPDGKYAISTGL